MHFGAEASAPVFHELAQQILEYLGVTHDIEVKSQPAMAKALAASGPQEYPAGTNESADELFAEVNNLPADDPLRAPKAADPEPETIAMNGMRPPPAGATLQPDSPAATPSPQVAFPGNPAPPSVPVSMVKDDRPPGDPPQKRTVVFDSRQRVAVPSFVGEPVRHVVELAGASGLAVEVVGNGLAREQAPAAGTMVPTGTEVVVKFSR
jgi:cell division protein FtsI (penicillin-binding protein 3)